MDDLYKAILIVVVIIIIVAMNPKRQMLRTQKVTSAKAGKPIAKPSASVANAVCFSGGGFTALSSHLSTLCHIALKHEVDAEKLFGKVDYMSGNSGGSWLMSLICYSQQFQACMNGEDGAEMLGRYFSEVVSPLVSREDFIMTQAKTVGTLLLKRDWHESVLDITMKKFEDDIKRSVKDVSPVGANKTLGWMGAMNMRGAVTKGTQAIAEITSGFGCPGPECNEIEQIPFYLRCDTSTQTFQPYKAFFRDDNATCRTKLLNRCRGNKICVQGDFNLSGAYTMKGMTVSEAMVMSGSFFGFLNNHDLISKMTHGVLDRFIDLINPINDFGRGFTSVLTMNAKNELGLRNPRDEKKIDELSDDHLLMVGADGGYSDNMGILPSLHAAIEADGYKKTGKQKKTLNLVAHDGNGLFTLLLENDMKYADNCDRLFGLSGVSAGPNQMWMIPSVNMKQVSNAVFQHTLPDVDLGFRSANESKYVPHARSFPEKLSIRVVKWYDLPTMENKVFGIPAGYLVNLTLVIVENSSASYPANFTPTDIDEHENINGSMNDLLNANPEISRELSLAYGFA